MPRFRNPVVSTAELLDGSVTTPKLANGAVTSQKIATDLESDNWDGTTVAARDATQGWRIERDTGDFGAQDAVLRGTLIAGAAGGGEVIIDPSTFASFGATPQVRLIPGVGAEGYLEKTNTSLGLVLEGVPIVNGWKPQIRLSNPSGTPNIIIWADDVTFQKPGVQIVLNALGDFGPLRIVTTNEIHADDGSAGDPSYTFASDQDTGMYRKNPNQLGFSAGGSEILSLIGGTTDHVDSLAIKNLTTGAGADVNVGNHGNGQLRRSTSALKYKARVTRNVGYLAEIELTPTKHWRRDEGRWRYGLIADWLAAEDPLLGEPVDGEIENYDTRAVIAVLAAKVNRLEEAARG